MPNVSLTPAMEKAIEDAVTSGEYASAAEVVREGIRLWQRSRNHGGRALAQLNAELEIGLRDIEAGNTTPYDMTPIVERIKASS